MDKIFKLNDFKAIWGADTLADYKLIGRYVMIFFRGGNTAILHYIGPYNLYSPSEILEHAQFVLIEDQELCEMAQLLYE